MKEPSRGLSGGNLDRRLTGRFGQILGDATDTLREHYPGDR